MSGSTEPANLPPRSGPTREAVATVVVTIALLAGFVWYIRPPRGDFKPAPLEELSEDCRKVDRRFVPSNITKIQDPPLTGLDPEQRLRVLRRLNFEACPCGCNQSIAECRVNHSQCKVCRPLAARILEDIKVAAPKPR